MTLIIALFLAPLTILTFSFVFEVLAGLRPLPQLSLGGGSNPTAVMVIPAHDEAAVLPNTLNGLLEASAGSARILLVADNCTDATAAFARRLGVQVIERFDTEKRGKGFALDFARHNLAAEPPDVVIIVDADCTIDAGSVASLIAACGATGRPCQATNLQLPQPGASPPVQLSTFAFFIKNVIRQRGLQRLAGRAHLLGTGMALPWEIFADSELATGNIVEDLKLGQDLSEAGHAPVFVEEATVWSGAETERNTLSQRTRWEGGFLRNAVEAGPRMLWRSLRRRDARGLWAAVNIMIPPIALLLFLDLLAIVVSTALTFVTGARPWPVFLLGAAILLTGLAVGLAWRAGGSRFATLNGLFRVPLYIAWKLPMYLALLRRGAPAEWLRTDRS